MCNCLKGFFSGLQNEKYKKVLNNLPITATSYKFWVIINHPGSPTNPFFIVQSILIVQDEYKWWWVCSMNVEELFLVIWGVLRYKAEYSSDSIIN